jgi:hypothetical protein
VDPIDVGFRCLMFSISWKKMAAQLNVPPFSRLSLMTRD